MQWPAGTLGGAGGAPGGTTPYMHSNQRPLALAFVPGLLRLGTPVGGASTPVNLGRPNTAFVPLRRGVAFNDVGPAFRPRTTSPVELRFRHTPTTRQKISAANKGNVPWNKGRPHSDETKQRISEATRAAMEAPAVRAKLRQLAVGRKHTEETKRKIRTATRWKRAEARGERPLARVPRQQVPFTFTPEMIAELDSNIVRRYKEEVLEVGVPSLSGPRRPMPAETKKKLSERIRAMWKDPDYRRRVEEGIEHRKSVYPEKSSLTDAHRAAISNTLKERHRARREALGIADGGVSKSRRKRTSPPSDPTAGTRLSDAALSPEAKRKRDERRKHARELLSAAEAHEEEMLSKQARRVAEQRRKNAAREEARRLRVQEEERRNNRLLLESLAMAGQLPSLEEECAMVGSTFRFGSATQNELPVFENSLFDAGQRRRSASPPPSPLPPLPSLSRTLVPEEDLDNDRMMFESLSLAGQLPSLDEDVDMTSMWL